MSLKTLTGSNTKTLGSKFVWQRAVMRRWEWEKPRHVCMGMQQLEMLTFETMSNLILLTSQAHSRRKGKPCCSVYRCSQWADVLLREYLFHFPFWNLRPVNDYLSRFISYHQGPPWRANLYYSLISFLGMPKQMTTNQVDQNKETYSFSVLEAVSPILSCLQGHTPSEDFREDFFLISSCFWCLLVFLACGSIPLTSASIFILLCSLCVFTYLLIWDQHDIILTYF